MPTQVAAALAVELCSTRSHCRPATGPGRVAAPNKGHLWITRLRPHLPTSFRRTPRPSAMPTPLKPSPKPWPYRSPYAPAPVSTPPHARAWPPFTYDAPIADGGRPATLPGPCLRASGPAALRRRAPPPACGYATSSVRTSLARLLARAVASPIPGRIRRLPPRFASAVRAPSYPPCAECGRGAGRRRRIFATRRGRATSPPSPASWERG